MDNVNFLKKGNKVKKVFFSSFFALVFLVLVVIFFSSILESSNEANFANKVYGQQEVPELVDILSQDQKTRLDGGRRLVERVDVEKALEILERSPLPHTGEGHLVVHQIGFYAYKKYGVDSILKCKDYFLYACYHGAIIEAASDNGFESIAKMTDRCKSLSKRYFQCVHAAGHSILAIWDYDLPESLKTCDELYERESNFPEALSSCHNGAFMENLFGVHDWGTGKEAKREWISDDLFFPCNAFEEKYQKGCWLNQAARIYQVLNGDLAKTRDVCERINVWEYTVWCVDNLARQIHPLTNGNINEVFNMCGEIGDYWREKCIVVNAGSFFSVGDPVSAIVLCKSFSPNSPAGADCFDNLIGQIGSEPIKLSAKRDLCKEIGGNFGNQCLFQIQN